MRASVRAAFYSVNAPWEGVVEHMYADVKGLVTVGVGNLIDPITSAVGLPWVHKDTDAPAMLDDVRADWERVKGDPSLARLGHRAAAKVTKLRLTGAGIHELVDRKLAHDVAILRGRFPGWDKMPADAQLAVACLAWAVGPHFRWPMLQAALGRGDYSMAALETTISEKGNPGVRPRNEGMRRMYRNAAWVVACDMDRDVLHYPSYISAEAETSPQLPDDGPVREEDGGVSRWVATREAARGEEP